MNFRDMVQAGIRRDLAQLAPDIRIKYIINFYGATENNESYEFTYAGYAWKFIPGDTWRIDYMGDAS